jgi:hypothetical protein
VLLCPYQECVGLALARLRSFELYSSLEKTNLAALVLGLDFGRYKKRFNRRSLLKKSSQITAFAPNTHLNYNILSYTQEYPAPCTSPAKSSSYSLSSSPPQ